jgi:hypothetical protein
MVSLSTIAKLLLLGWALYWNVVFAVSRVGLFYEAVRVYGDRVGHAQNFCGMCKNYDMLSAAGEFASRCSEACELAHEAADPLEVGLKAVVDNTYMCGYVPCEEVWAQFNLKACLFVLLLLYGEIYMFTTATTLGGSKDSSASYQPKSCWLVALVESIFGVAVKGLSKIMHALDGTGIKDHDL